MTGARQLAQPFFARSALEVARDLIGCTLLFDGVGGRIVETEAYRQDDPCCHGYRGMTKRNAVLFGPPGHLYVYFTYGMHFCANVACEPQGVGAGVLLRALEPEQGLDQMTARRRRDAPAVFRPGAARSGSRHRPRAQRAAGVGAATRDLAAGGGARCASVRSPRGDHGAHRRRRRCQALAFRRRESSFLSRPLPRVRG